VPFKAIFDVSGVIWRKRLALSGFPRHLASFFDRSFLNRKNNYALSNDLPNYFASYSGNPGSFMNYQGSTPMTYFLYRQGR